MAVRGIDESSRNYWLFLGRHEVLDAIAAGFQQGGVVGMLTGPVGSGKSFLAQSFATKHGLDLFPAGVGYSTAFSIKHTHFAPATTRRPGDGLTIIDDADIMPPGLNALLADHRARGSRVLLVCHRKIEGMADFTVTVPPFDYSDIGELVQAALGRPRPDLVDAIASLAGASTLAIRQAVEWLASRPEATAGDLRAGLEPFAYFGPVDPEGRPIGADGESTLVTDVREVNRQLLLHLADHPDAVRSLSHRQFENVVAEILMQFGYEVRLTPMSRDGGKDIYVATKHPLGSFLYLVECKLYAPDQPVGVSLVRNLYGVVEAERATAGVLVTTSYFTRPAQEFRETVQHRLCLRNYADLKTWLDRIRANDRGVDRVF